MLRKLIAITFMLIILFSVKAYAESAQQVACAAYEALYNCDYQKYTEYTQYGIKYQTKILHTINQGLLNNSMHTTPERLIWGSDLSSILTYNNIQRRCMAYALAEQHTSPISVIATPLESESSEWGAEIDRNQREYIESVNSAYGMSFENYQTLTMSVENAAGDIVDWPDLIMVQFCGDWFIYEAGYYGYVYGLADDINWLNVHQPRAATPKDKYQQICVKYLEAFTNMDARTIMELSILSSSLNQEKIAIQSKAQSLFSISEIQYNHMFFPEESSVQDALYMNEKIKVPYIPVIMNTRALSDTDEYTRDSINTTIVPLLGNFMSDIVIVDMQFSISANVVKCIVCEINGSLYIFDFSVLSALK